MPATRSRPAIAGGPRLAARAASLAPLLAALAAQPAQAGSFTTLRSNDAAAWSVQGHIAKFKTSVIGAAAGSSSANLFSPPATAGQPWTSTIIHSFTGQAGDGAYPDDGLILAAGRAYGVTSGGGNAGCANGCGTLFSLTPPASGTGAWTETQIYLFNADQNGFAPRTVPVIAGGKIYGTATAASNDTTRPGDTTSSGGVAYQLAPSKTGGWTYTLLHHFDAQSLDGTGPNGALARDAAGNLYGHTFLGGSCGYGVIYRLSPPATLGQAWTYSKLHDFGATGGAGCDYNDGRQPLSGLTLSGNALYGATSAGTGQECGTVFKIDLGTSPASYSQLYRFTRGTGGACAVQAQLSVSAAGIISGAATQGGSAPANTECPSGCGALFTLTPQPGGGFRETILHSFTGGTDGAAPRTNLLPYQRGLIGLASHGGQPGDTANADYLSFGTLFLAKP